jgi:hypothetical protein
MARAKNPIHARCTPTGIQDRWIERWRSLVVARAIGRGMYLSFSALDPILARGA